jgi:hypothetical protein
LQKKINDSERGKISIYRLGTHDLNSILLGVEINLAILREIKDYDMLFEQLSSFKNIFQKETTLGCSPGELKYEEAEAVLEQLKTLLLKIYTEKDSPLDFKKLILQLLAKIGMLKSSFEDFLMIANLLNESEFEINLSEALSNTPFTKQNTKEANDTLQAIEQPFKTVVWNHLNELIEISTICYDYDYGYAFNVKTNKIFKFSMKSNDFISAGVEIIASKKFKNPVSSMTLINGVSF